MSIYIYTYTYIYIYTYICIQHRQQQQGHAIYAPVNISRRQQLFQRLWNTKVDEETARSHECYNKEGHDSLEPVSKPPARMHGLTFRALNVTWLIHTSDITRSCVSSIRVPWLIQMCDMTYSYVLHDLGHDSLKSISETAAWINVLWMNLLAWTWHHSFKCVPWLVHMCDMTHAYV